MPSFDRTDIVNYLKKTFPELDGMSGEQVQDFLNLKTGLSVASETPNGTAFDLWRQALAGQGNPDLWPYSADHISKIKERTEKLLELEQERKG